MSQLFSPLQLRKLTIKNRIVMSPMCQYSAIDGFPNDWHYVHYVTRAVGGAGTIIQEATAVLPEGRISYADLGIWKDEHIEAYKKITAAIQKYGAVPGIQLAHAGRKASCDLANKGGAQIKEGANAWQTVAPSAIPFLASDTPPVALSADEIKEVTKAFKAAAIRSIKAGYKIIEIHAAHGYLIHEFFSPLTNTRTDAYGGSLANRVRILFDIIDEILPLITDDLSLWVRISATDWVEGGWDLAQSVELSKLLREKGVDVIDVSTGGLVPDAKIPVAPGYQVPFAERIKQESGMTTGTVGLLTEATQMEELLETEKCDLVFLGRKLLRDPYFPINAAKELDAADIAPSPYSRRH